ncbi:GntR family transcriptional regulator [Leucobacter sp. NPDC058333]|uniref:GntR family transcriptional regulator n=1 Tax=Leucobacter sp. NPDC058333 TaxID=3346450 RepID=UPI00364943C9
MSKVVYLRIADELRERIVSGQLAPGADVPTEAELSELWQTSRGPVRNALATLKAEGLVDTGRGRPARVARREPAQALDVNIPFTRWAESIGAVPGAVTQHISRRRSDASIAEEFGIAVGDAVVEVLRLRLLDGRPTMLERLVYTEEVGRVLFTHDLDRVSITELLADAGFLRGGVTHEIDAIAAEPLDGELLGVAEGSPILRLHRVSRDSEGRITEVSDDHYRSDIVRFTLATPDPQTRPAPGAPYLRGLTP